MNVRVRPAIAASLLLAASALAQEKPGGAAPPGPAPTAAAPVAVSVPTRWETGETVTLTCAETRSRGGEEQRNPKKPKRTISEERKIEAELVIRCDEATKDGAFVRGRTWVKSWRRTETGESADASATGVHADLLDRECRIVADASGAAGAKEPSDRAKAWVVGAFDGCVPQWCSAREYAVDVAPLAVGASAPLQGENSGAAADFTLTLVSARPSKDGLEVELRKSGVRRNDGSGGDRTTVELLSTATAVLERWHRTADESFRRTITIVERGLTRTETTTRTRKWRAGGEIPPRPGETAKPPAVPAPSPPPPPK
jgi:hypothetical protein